MRQDFDSRSTDAGVWARAFCKMNPAIDEGMMLGWFANAIDAGFNCSASVSSVDSNKKGKPKTYHITTVNGVYPFTGWTRKDLDANSKNWHYYETTDGRIIHFRSEHMVAVEEGVEEE